MAIFKSSKIVVSKFNVKKSTGPDVFNIVENSKNVSIVGKQLNGDTLTFTGNAADYAISASGNNVAIRFVNDAGKFVTVKFSIKDTESVTLAFADGGFVVDNLAGKGKIAVRGEDGNFELVSKRYLSIENYLDLDGEGDQDQGAFLDPELATSALDSINTIPVFTSTNAITLNEDVTFNGQLAATDADGHSLTYALVSNQGESDGAAVVNSDGTFTYTPAPNFNGADSFVVSVSDGKGGVVQQTILVTVNPLNDVPMAIADDFAATEGAALVAGTVATNDSDVDGEVLTYALAPTQAPVAGLTFNSNGSFLFDPSNAAYQSLAADAPLAVVVNYTVTDGKVTTPSTLTLNITGTNDLPVFTSASTATVNEDNVLTGTLVATDVDVGDVLTYSVVTGPSNGSLGLVGSSYTYTPAAGFSGTDSFVVSVSDGNDGEVQQTISVTVTEGDIAYGLTDGVDVLTGQGVRNVFQETADGQFSQDDIIAGGQFDATAEDVVVSDEGGDEGVETTFVPRNDDDTLLLRSDTVTDVQFTNTTGIERLVMNSANGTGDDSVTLGAQASEAGIVLVETRGGDDRVDVSAVTNDIAVDAGEGSDTLVLSGELGDVTLDLNENSLDIENITITGFENVDASALVSGALTVTANAADSTILGSAQDDTITGGVGVDVIRGGLGADVINTGAGANIVVFVGTLDAADNALYADYDGTVVVGGQTLNLGGVVTRDELTQLKAESDVSEGEALLSNPDDTIVIFGTADLSGLAAFPFPNTFVVNSSLTLRFDQINNDTQVLGGLIGDEQTPSELIITDLPNAVIELDALSLAGVEKLVLAGLFNGENASVTFPDSFVGEVFVLVDGEEVLVSPARDFIVEDGVVFFKDRDFVEEFIKAAVTLETDATSITVVEGDITLSGFTTPQTDEDPTTRDTPDVLVLLENREDVPDFEIGEPQTVDLTGATAPIVVRGNDATQIVDVMFGFSGADNIVLDLAGGIDEVNVNSNEFSFDGRYSVTFVSGQIGDGSDQDVTVRDTEVGNSFTVNDEGTVLSIGDDREFGPNAFNVQGINTDGSIAEGQNRGNFSYVALGTSGSDYFEADKFGRTEIGGNVYINAGGGNDFLSADAVGGQRHFLVGGTGNDEITVSATENSTVVVLAGGGDDNIVIDQIVDYSDNQEGSLLPYAGNYELNGGAGRDSLQISAVLSAELASEITGFEVLAFNVDSEYADDLIQDLQAFGPQNAINTIRVDEIDSGAVILNNVGDAVTTLELVDGGDIEDSFTISRLNDTDTNAITITTSPANDEESFTYDVEGELNLNDEEFITINTGSKVARFDDEFESFNTSDLDVEALYAEDLQTLTVVGDGDVDLKNVYLGTIARVVKVDASGSTGDFGIDVSESGEGISISYIGSSGENDVEGTDSGDTITVVSDASDNDIEGRGGEDTISFTGDGFSNEIDGGGDDDTITVDVMFNEEASDGEFFTQVDIDGDAGDDTITVTGTGIVDIDGGDGDDTIVSGDGDDRIQGGSGADTLTGGDGKDTFVYFAGDSDPVSAGFDTITDFDVDDDRLMFLTDDLHSHGIFISETANDSQFTNEAGLLAGLAALDVANTLIGQDAVLFVVGTDGYLFVDTNDNDQYDVSSTTGDNDVLIKLVGVTDIADINFGNVKAQSLEFNA